MAIALTNNTNDVFASGFSSYALTHTISSGSDRLLLVFITFNNEGTPVVTDVTWDAAGANEALTKIDGYVSIDDAAVDAYYLIAPSVGSVKDITVDLDSAMGRSISIIAFSLTGVDQTSPIADYDGEGNQTADELDAVLSLAQSGDFLAGAGIIEVSTISTWVQSTVTMTGVQDETLDGATHTAAYGSADGAGETLNVLWGSADHCVMMGVAVQPVQISYKLEGITKDKDGNALGSCVCHLVKNPSTGNMTPLQRVVSNATTGAYSFTGIGDNDSEYLVIAWKDNTPHVFDCTDWVLTPVTE